VSSTFSVVNSDGVLKPLFRLATPVLIEQVLVVLVAFVDQWLAGRFLRAPHLAAISLVWYVMWVIPSVFGLVAIGAGALTARMTGAGQWKDARRLVNQAYAAGAILCVATMIASWIFAKPFVAAMQLEPEAASLALRYFYFLIPLYPAIMLEQIGIAALRGAGDTISGFIAMSVVNLINTTVGIVLVTGAGPFPELGWDGLAIGTALGYLVGATIVVSFLLRGRAGLQLTRQCLKPDWEMIRRILRIGVPGGIDVVSLTFCHLWFLAIINSLGTIEAAAHGLSVRIESIAYLPGTAFQVAAATMAGQFVGARDWRRATRSVWTTCLVGGTIMTSAGAAMFVFAEPMTLFFLGKQTQAVATLAAPLLQIVAYSMPFLAALMIVSGALRGVGDTRTMLAVTLFGLLMIRIPLAYWFAMERVQIPWLGLDFQGLGYGVQGAWWAMVFDVVIRSLLVGARFVCGGWRRVTA